MFHNRQLSIPRIEDDFKIGTGVGSGIGVAGHSLHPSGAMDESDYNSDMPRNSLFGTFFFMHFLYLLHEYFMSFPDSSFFANIDCRFTCEWITLASLCSHIGQPLFYCLVIADRMLRVYTSSLPFPSLSTLLSLYSIAPTPPHQARHSVRETS
jgi:hypothetical protein